MATRRTVGLAILDGVQSHMFALCLFQIDTSDNTVHILLNSTPDSPNATCATSTKHPHTLSVCEVRNSRTIEVQLHALGYKGVHEGGRGR